MNANGSNQIKITNNTFRDTGPNFSRDGSKITFQNNMTSNMEIYKMNLDGTNQTNLTNNAAGDRHTSYSTDNTKIAFDTDRDANSEIYSMNANGSNPVNLTNNSANDKRSNWGSGSVPAPADVTAPSAPTMVGFSPSNTEINLYWQASSDNVGVAGYKVYNAITDVEVASASNTYYLFGGLTPGTSYSYYVKAYDAAGNYSAAGNIISINTGAGGATNSGSGVDPVTVSLNSNVTLTFADITGSGTTSVTISPTLASPAPSGFNFYGNQLDISTSAMFTPPITIAIHYDPSTISINEADLKLFHWNGSSWEDVTLYVDTANNVIVGQVNSLSPFILGGPSEIATGADTHSKTIAGFLLLIAGLVLGLRNKRQLKNDHPSHN